MGQEIATAYFNLHGMTSCPQGGGQELNLSDKKIVEAQVQLVGKFTLRQREELIKFIIRYDQIDNIHEEQVVNTANGLLNKGLNSNSQSQPLMEVPFCFFKKKKNPNTVLNSRTRC